MRVLEEVVDGVCLREVVVGVLGMTASAESVVMKVEMLAMEARNLFSLTAFGSVKPSPSMISFAFVSSELVVCHDSRIDRPSSGLERSPLLAEETIW